MKKIEDLMNMLAAEESVDRVVVTNPQLKKTKCSKLGIDPEMKWHAKVFFLRPMESLHGSILRRKWFMGSCGPTIEDACRSLLKNIAAFKGASRFSPDETSDE